RRPPGSCGRPRGRRGRAAALAPTAPRARRPCRGLARAHGRLALRRRRDEQEAELDDRLRAPTQRSACTRGRELVRRAAHREHPAQPPSFERVVELNRGPLLTGTAAMEALAPARARRL